MKKEISFHYENLTNVEMAEYQLHLKLSSIFNMGDAWMNFDREVHEITKHKLEMKYKTLHKKFKGLIKNPKLKPNNRNMNNKTIKLCDC